MSQYPVINAGTTPTAAVLQAMIQQAVRKSTNQSVTSSTVLVNDSALLVPVAANATYEFKCMIFYSGAATGTGDIKYGLSLPSGATTVYGALAIDLGSINTLRLYYLTGGTGTSGSNGASPVWARLEGTVVTSGTAGNLQLQWAQNTSSATATTVVTGSYLTARRIA